MSFQYPCSVGNYLREELQEHRETISEMQKTIDDLVFQRDQAMDDLKELLPQYEYYRRQAEFLEKQMYALHEFCKKLENKNETK